LLQLRKSTMFLFLAGVLVGSVAGVCLMCLMAAARSDESERGDEKAEAEADSSAPPVEFAIR